MGTERWAVADQEDPERHSYMRTGLPNPIEKVAEASASVPCYTKVISESSSSSKVLGPILCWNADKRRLTS
jgi:hypothetical protein